MDLERVSRHDAPAAGGKEKNMEKQAGAMATAVNGKDEGTTLAVWWPCGLLCLWALLIRLLAVGKVFPAVGDVSHYVQYGKVYAATGQLEGLSALWALAPQFLSAWSMKLGFIPQYVMQGTTVVFGVLAVTGVYALAMELTNRRRVAIVAGVLVATNPAMTYLAATGFSDTPHFALGTWALALGFAGARKRKTWPFVIAIVLASLDLYWRPFDLFVWLLAAAPFIGWRLLGCGWRWFVKLAGGVLGVGMVCSLPYFMVTNAISGWNPGRSKLGNLALGESGTNAKDLYAQSGLDAEKTALSMRQQELEQNGVAKYLWLHRAEISRRYPSNIVSGMRALNSHMFAGMFRMGLFWFLLFMILCATGLGGVAGLYMVLSIGGVLCSVSLGFINPRWIIQCVPFGAILAGGGFDWLLSRFSSRHLSRVAWGVFLVIGVLNGRWAVLQLNDEWRQQNVFPVCERLHQWMGEDERVMCFTPELPALFYRKNALDYDILPYDSVERVFAQAEACGTGCIVLNASMFPHFPIHAIERNPELIPPPWREVDKLEFTKETRFGLEHDGWRFYRREADGIEETAQ